MSKKTKNYVMTVIGVLLLTIALYMIKVKDAQGIMRVLPYICIGIGSGIFGHGIGSIVNERVMKKNPLCAKQISIEENDERNITISNKSKAKAYDMMVFVFGALMISFALMEIDLMAVLLLVGAYLFVIGYGIYYRLRYEKEL